MNYAKPEVAVLGQAVRVIEQTHLKVAMGQTDPNPKITTQFNPAYDLDE
jgi:hypothetical protein